MGGIAGCSPYNFSILSECLKILRRCWGEKETRLQWAIPACNPTAKSQNYNVEWKKPDPKENLGRSPFTQFWGFIGERSGTVGLCCPRSEHGYSRWGGCLQGVPAGRWSLIQDYVCGLQGCVFALWQFPKLFAEVCPWWCVWLHHRFGCCFKARWPFTRCVEETRLLENHTAWWEGLTECKGDPALAENLATPGLGVYLGEFSLCAGLGYVLEHTLQTAELCSLVPGAHASPPPRPSRLPRFRILLCSDHTPWLISLLLVVLTYQMPFPLAAWGTFLRGLKTWNRRACSLAIIGVNGKMGRRERRMVNWGRIEEVWGAGETAACQQGD